MVWDVAHTLLKGIALGLLKVEVQGKKVKVNGLCMFMRYCEAYDFVLLVVTCKVPIMLMFMRFYQNGMKA